MQRDLYDDDHEMFRASFRAFWTRRCGPNFEQWEHDGIVPREVFAGPATPAILGMAVPEEFGGGGVNDFRYNAVVAEEVQPPGSPARRWASPSTPTSACPTSCTSPTTSRRPGGCPASRSGELITAVAMTEPGIGSDLAGMSTTADPRRRPLHRQRFEDLHLQRHQRRPRCDRAVKTDPTPAPQGHEPAGGRAGYGGLRAGPQPRQGRPARARTPPSCSSTTYTCPSPTASATRELVSCSWCATCPQERLSIANAGVAAAQAAFAWTLDYCEGAQGIRPADRLLPGTRDSPWRRCAPRSTSPSRTSTAASPRTCAASSPPRRRPTAKWWCTELQKRVVDQCVQLHGGYGYMLEYPIARAYTDARITTIYGGTTEIMKEIVGRSLGV